MPPKPKVDYARVLIAHILAADLDKFKSVLAAIPKKMLHSLLVKESGILERLHEDLAFFKAVISNVNPDEAFDLLQNHYSLKAKALGIEVSAELALAYWPELLAEVVVLGKLKLDHFAAFLFLMIEKRDVGGVLAIADCFKLFFPVPKETKALKDFERDALSTWLQILFGLRTEVNLQNNAALANMIMAQAKNTLFACLTRESVFAFLIYQIEFCHDFSNIQKADETYLYAHACLELTDELDLTADERRTLGHLLERPQIKMLVLSYELAYARAQTKKNLEFAIRTVNSYFLTDQFDSAIEYLKTLPAGKFHDVILDTAFLRTLLTIVSANDDSLALLMSIMAVCVEHKAATHFLLAISERAMHTKIVVISGKSDKALLDKLMDFTIRALYKYKDDIDLEIVMPSGHSLASIALKNANPGFLKIVLDIYIRHKSYDLAYRQMLGWLIENPQDANIFKMMLENGMLQSFIVTSIYSTLPKTFQDKIIKIIAIKSKFEVLVEEDIQQYLKLSPGDARSIKLWLSILVKLAEFSGIDLYKEAMTYQTTLNKTREGKAKASTHLRGLIDYLLISFLRDIGVDSKLSFKAKMSSASSRSELKKALLETFERLQKPEDLADEKNSKLAKQIWRIYVILPVVNYIAEISFFNELISEITSTGIKESHDKIGLSQKMISHAEINIIAEPAFPEDLREQVRRLVSPATVLLEDFDEPAQSKAKKSNKKKKASAGAGGPKPATLDAKIIHPAERTAVAALPSVDRELWETDLVQCEEHIAKLFLAAEEFNQAMAKLSHPSLQKTLKVYPVALKSLKEVWAVFIENPYKPLPETCDLDFVALKVACSHLQKNMAILPADVRSAYEKIAGHLGMLTNMAEYAAQKRLTGDIKQNFKLLYGFWLEILGEGFQTLPYPSVSAAVLNVEPVLPGVTTEIAIASTPIAVSDAAHSVSSRSTESVVTNSPSSSTSAQSDDLPVIDLRSLPEQSTVKKHPYSDMVAQFVRDSENIRTLLQQAYHDLLSYQVSGGSLPVEMINRLNLLRHANGLIKSCQIKLAFPDIIYNLDEPIAPLEFAALSKVVLKSFDEIVMEINQALFTWNNCINHLNLAIDRLNIAEISPLVPELQGYLASCYLWHEDNAILTHLACEYLPDLVIEKAGTGVFHPSHNLDYDLCAVWPDQGRDLDIELNIIETDMKKRFPTAKIEIKTGLFSLLVTLEIGTFCGNDKPIELYITPRSVIQGKDEKWLYQGKLSKAPLRVISHSQPRMELFTGRVTVPHTSMRHILDDVLELDCVMSITTMPHTIRTWIKFYEPIQRGILRLGPLYQAFVDRLHALKDNFEAPENRELRDALKIAWRNYARDRPQAFSAIYMMIGVAFDHDGKLALNNLVSYPASSYSIASLYYGHTSPQLFVAAPFGGAGLADMTPPHRA